MVSGILIDEEEDSPSSSAFRHRFGSLVSAYKLIGYNPAVDYAFIEANRALRRQYPEILLSTQQNIQARGATVVIDERSQVLTVESGITISIVLCRHVLTKAGSSRWVVKLEQGLRPDLTIAVRMNPSGNSIRDYYLLPMIDMTWEHLRVAEDNGIYLDAYRFDSLEYLFELTTFVRLKEAA